MTSRLMVLQAAIRERVTHDLGFARHPIAWAAYTAGRALANGWTSSQRARGWRWLMRLHSAAFSDSIDKRVANDLRHLHLTNGGAQLEGIGDCVEAAARSAMAAFVSGPNP